ncbi:4859_t:CDS:2 [Acaulospora morrowiae]|uniref:4859_t:CDS:1 n=1 Tax=Acaulospora morrowiae TaxID=94023 RepID=A0A9N9HHT8_9GLOM|nr:4859_t:CDS:2 [Acaulospora morrowiae]
MQVENRQQKDWSAAEEDKENKNQLEETQPLTWEQQRQKDIEMFEEGIIYSQRYYGL